MTTYITKAGDDIDGILWAELGRTDDATEREFWTLNPGAALQLTAAGNFPQGVELALPAGTESAAAQAVSPWD